MPSSRMRKYVSCPERERPSMRKRSVWSVKKSLSRFTGASHPAILQSAPMLITSPSELAAIEPDWLALCRRTPGTTPFQTPMWILPWWKHFGSDELAVIATAEALAPLYIVRDGDESLGMFLGTGNSDYLDVVGDAAAIIDQLATLDCQMWDLQQLRPSSSMLSIAPPDGWSDSVDDHDV